MKIEIDFKQLEDSLKRQVPYIRKETQALLENLHEELGNWLKRTEVDEYVTPINPNQERKDFIEDAKRFWEEHGESKGYVLLNSSSFWFIGKVQHKSNDIVFNINSYYNANDIPLNYCQNKYLFKAYLLDQHLNLNKYHNITPPLPVDFSVKGIITTSNGTLLDDTEAEY